MLRVLLPVLVVGSVATAAAPPAQAHTDGCSGLFSMVPTIGLGLPLNPVSTPFTMAQTLGGCLSGTVFSASGVFSGACALASGGGVTNTGHHFTFQLVGTEMVFSNQVTGVLHVVDDPGDSGTCANGTARGFLLQGTLLLTGD